MKLSFYLIFAAIIFYSCDGIVSNKVANTGIVNVINGADKEDTVRYTCDSCDKYIHSTDVLNRIIDQATKEAKASLNNPLSFIPRSIKMTVEPQDSFYYYSNNKHIDSCIMVNVDYECIGKNAYGTEGLVKTSSLIFLVGNKIQDDFISIIRRKPLKSEDGKIVDRSLNLYDIEGEGKFSILPTLRSPYSLIVNSSISCIDKGAILTISFDDKSEIRLSNWNGFNCKGTAYFNLSQNSLEKLKANKITNISFYVESGKSQFAKVLENESDYFIQYTGLIK